MLRSILLVLGIVAAVAAGTTLVISVVKLTRGYIRNYLRQRNLSHAIVNNIDTGNYNTVNIGLYDESCYCEEIEIQADEIASNIRENTVIYS